MVKGRLTVFLNHKNALTAWPRVKTKCKETRPKTGLFEVFEMIF